MVITCYKTGLDPAHRRVSADTPAYLSHLTPYPRSIAGDVLAGAPSLTIELETNGDGHYNYCAIDDAQHNTFYYFMSPVRNSPKSTIYGLSMDWWSYVSTARTPLLESGILRRSHLLYLHADTFAPSTHPVAGEIAGASAFEAVNQSVNVGDNPELYYYVSVVVSATLNDNRSVLFFSPRVSPRTEPNVLRGYIYNMTNATDISIGDATQITSINSAWLVPWSFVGVNTEPNAAIVIGNDATTTMPVYWFTQSYNQDIWRYIPQQINPTICGNFGTNVTIPFIGKNPTPCVLSFRFAAHAGKIALVLRVGESVTDLTQSVSVEFSTNRATERDITRNIANAVSVVGGVVAAAGGIMSANPVAIAMGVTSLGGTVAGIATQQTTQHVAQDGLAMVNIAYRKPITGGEQSFTISPCGVARYYVKNFDELNGELSRYGYSGAALVENFDLAQSGGRVDGAYFQFTDPVIRRENAGLCLPEACANEIENMCLNGYTCYFDTLETLAFGSPLNPPPTNFDIDGNPVS